MNKPNQYSLKEATKKKWQENASDPQDDKYELPILEYNAKKDALVE
jgi:hypothetical protein